MAKMKYEITKDNWKETRECDVCGTGWEIYADDIQRVSKNKNVFVCPRCSNRIEIGGLPKWLWKDDVNP